MAVKWHPDRNADNREEATARFDEIAEAYEVLSDAQRRGVYDQYGEDGLKRGVPAGEGLPGFAGYTYSGDADALFVAMFGGESPFTMFVDTRDGPAKSSTFGASARAQGPRAQDPEVIPVRLSLEQLYSGCTEKMTVTRRILNDDNQTTRQDATVLSLPIKAGFSHNTRITFEGAGDQGPGLVPRDIVFVVHQKTHKSFVRDGHDLVYNSRVSLLHALTGFTVHIPTLDGRKLAIPISDTVEPGYSKRVIGEGMPIASQPGARGDLILTFDIVFPPNLNSQQKALVRQALGGKAGAGAGGGGGKKDKASASS